MDNGVCIPAISFHTNNLELDPVTSVLCIHQTSVLFTININSPQDEKSCIRETPGGSEAVAVGISDK